MGGFNNMSEIVAIENYFEEKIQMLTIPFLMRTVLIRGDNFDANMPILDCSTWLSRERILASSRFVIGGSGMNRDCNIYPLHNFFYTGR